MSVHTGPATAPGRTAARTRSTSSGCDKASHCSTVAREVDTTTLLTGEVPALVAGRVLLYLPHDPPKPRPREPKSRDR
ncbi:hypothetical protein GCM10010492_65390 [Saccharothrix mutabilis subsp. mutabilis]|uniref:Uncharacterized protein n=1 Tax=Saccharothrix mutabilis subsp. mutabilis TaxID=66855 RepID=A0ABP3EB42_9PSEU